MIKSVASKYIGSIHRSVISSNISNKSNSIGLNASKRIINRSAIQTHISSSQAMALIQARHHPALSRQFSTTPSLKERLNFLFARYSSVEAAKQAYEGSINTSDQQRCLKEYLDALENYCVRDPEHAMKLILSAWEKNKLPVNDEVIKVLFIAAAKGNRIKEINIQGIVSYYEKYNATREANASQTMPSNQLGSMYAAKGQSVIPPLPGQEISPTALLMSQATGSDPSTPIYVKNVQEKRTVLDIIFRVLFTLLAVIVFVAVVDMFVKANGSNNGISGRLGIMNNVVHVAETSDKSFDDVVGIDEAKAELEEIVFYLKDPDRFTRLGGVLPKGILLTGPPGTGKTLLARAIAGEAGVPFFYTSGSAFEEMYVGLGARRVRDLFAAAKAKTPCIIFIDEIDAVGGSRNLKEQSAMKATLNQLLVEMDGFEQNKGIIVIGATNFADSLDAALTRPGRFDKHVDVPMPDIGGRKAILDLYAKKVPLASDVDLEQLARGTPGFSGAELFNLVNQAAIKASVEGMMSVGMSAFEYAKDKIMMGAERKSAIISPETMKLTAYHEAGHAIVALLTDGSDPVHKATIMPRGRALGMVMQLPEGDQTSMSYKQMIARLDICMGGRVAEELIFGAENVTSGASSDIQQATRLAKAMVTRYGFSSKLGPHFLDYEKEKASGETMRDVDEEVRTLLKDSYERTRQLLHNRRGDLEIVAKGLMDYESLSGSEIVDLLNGRQPVKGVTRSQRPSRQSKPVTVPKNTIPAIKKPVMKPLAPPTNKTSLPPTGTSTPPDS